MIRKRGAGIICARVLKTSQIWKEEIWRGAIVIGKKTRRKVSGRKPNIWRIDDISRTWQDGKRNDGK